MNGLASFPHANIDRVGLVAGAWLDAVNANPSPEPPEIDGAALILAIAARRDRTAFAALFGWYAPRLKTWMMRRGASAQRAEDLAQEALLTVWRKAERFDPARAGAAAWIFTIARNLQIDAYRRDRAPEAADPSEAADPPIQPDSGLVSRERDARLREAVRALPDEQLTVVRLSFFSDKPHAEIAAELGLPLGTVKSRLRLALVRLRAGLEDYR